MSTSDDSATWFPSKVDWWMRIVLLLPPIAMLWALGVTLSTPGQPEIGALVIGFVTVIAIYGGLVFPVRYGIGADELVVRSGMTRQHIKLSAIQDVTPSRSALSSPALSMDRLAVRTGAGFNKTTLISPDDREVFLFTLATAAGLRRDGDRLVREHEQDAT